MLEDSIRSELIPILTDEAPLNDSVHELMVLPTRLTALLHYGTVLARLSENYYGSIKKSSASGLHWPQKTTSGPDGPVLTNNQKLAESTPAVSTTYLLKLIKHTIYICI